LTERQMATWSREQELAISLKGKNLLVSAAAGAGKTSVLVERVIRYILSEESSDIEKLLVVTFTEKAALEMKERIRVALEKAFERHPDDHRLARQISLLDRAHISTIHSFCLHIVRRYFYKAGLDPTFTVLDPREAELLRIEALDEVFEDWYRQEPDQDKSNGTANSRDLFLDLIERYGGYRVDEGLKSLLLKLHDFVRTQSSVMQWLDDCVSKMQELEKAAKNCKSEDEVILKLPWTRILLETFLQDIEEAIVLLEEAKRISSEPDGPFAYVPRIEEELTFYQSAKKIVSDALRVSESSVSVAKCCGGARDGVTDGVSGEVQDSAYWNDTQLTCNCPCAEVLERVRRLADYRYKRLSSKKMDCDPVLREKVKTLRNEAKERFSRIKDYAFTRSGSQIISELKETIPYVRCICDLVKELDKKYMEKKLDRGGLDFSDLELYCLKILTQDDFLLAKEIRKEFDYVLVDEYQDTNPVQNKILSLVSSPSNLFVVGDIKQSIYRFRLADPRIFLKKYQLYEKVGNNVPLETKAPGVRVELSKNFRSRREVIEAVNYLFKRIMKKDVAEIDYTTDHKLKEGAFYPEAEDRSFQAEIHLIERSRISDESFESGRTQLEGDKARGEKDAENTSSEDLSSEIDEYEALEKETLVVANNIKKLVNAERPFMIWDKELKCQRPCRYKDIAILMRATSKRANTVIEILEECNIPAYSDLGTGYFQAREVELALALLSIIDNPRQDIPLASVLRSAIVGLEPKDLAIIRVHHKNGEFYDAVKSFVGAGQDLAVGMCSRDQTSTVHTKDVLRIKKALSEFMENLEKWRTMARRLPLCEVLWTILRETKYYDYVGGLPGGAQRQANLRALVDRAREFDSFGRHGLFRFLRFMDRLEQSKGELGTARPLGEHEDVVQILSVHKAKGLEFPAVFVIDLGKRHNLKDADADILYHPELGFGLMFCDVKRRLKYPTLPHQAISIQLQKESLAEEMRILYVAMTRAREKLYLVGSIKNLLLEVQRWQIAAPRAVRSYLDWICPSLWRDSSGSNRGFPAFGSSACSNMGGLTNEPTDKSKEIPFSVTLWGVPKGQEIPQPSAKTLESGELSWKDVKSLIPPPSLPDERVYPEVKRRLEWIYPYQKFTLTTAKLSVTEAKKSFGSDETDGWNYIPGAEQRMRLLESSSEVTGAEKGTAMHTILAKMRLCQGLDEDSIYREVARLCKLGFVDAKIVGNLDISRICTFFQTPTGKLLANFPGKVSREVPFTIRFPVNLLKSRVGEQDTAGLSQTSTKPPVPNFVQRLDDAEKGVHGANSDFIVIQGVIDVLFEGEDGLIVLDYKTDDISLSEIPFATKRYSMQISLYALAAERILQKPVKKASLVFLTPGREVDVDWKNYVSRIKAIESPLSRMM